MRIQSNLASVKARVAAAATRSGRNADEITLIAVTKTRSAEEMFEAVRAGVRDVGENKVQEITEKYDRLEALIAETFGRDEMTVGCADAKSSCEPLANWHMIGHLQTNKVKYIIEKVDLIHSVDSLKLAMEIDRRAALCGKAAAVLIQVNPADEESKFGVGMAEAEPLAEQIGRTLPNVKVCGLMSIAPASDDPETVRPYFREVKGLFDRMAIGKPGGAEMKHLSMGMTADFEVAIEEGSNIVRVGTAIFGPRTYP